MGCSPWVHEESDTTEQLAHIHAQSRMVSVPYEQIKESTIRGPWERVTILARGIRRVSEKMWGRPQGMKKDLKSGNCRPGHLKHTLYFWCLGCSEWEEWDRQIKNFSHVFLSSWLSLWIVKGMKGTRTMTRWWGHEEVKSLVQETSQNHFSHGFKRV